MILVKDLFSSEQDDSHVSKIFHLFLTICDTLIGHFVISYLDLCLYIIAGKKDKFEALVAVLAIFVTPDLHLISILMIDTVKSVFTLPIMVHESDRIWGWRWKLLKFLKATFVVANEFSTFSPFFCQSNGPSL